MSTFSYKPSPDGIYRLSQSTHSLGGSGLLEIGPLTLHEGDESLVFYNRYLLLSCRKEWNCWNPEGTRCFFLAKRYPEGTFPEAEDDLPEDKAELVIAVVSVALRKVVHETVLGARPLSVRWNPTGEWVVITRDDQREQEILKGRARSEYDRALSYMRSTESIQGDDPADDPTRLEHYLMNYDARYCGPDPFAYAVRQRNLFLQAEKRASPYDEHILEEKNPPGDNDFRNLL